MDTGITKTTKKELASVDNLNEWGLEEIKVTDIKMPWLSLVQGLSASASEEGVSLGDIYDSGEGKSIGSMKNPVRFIPSTFLRQLYKQVAEGGEWKFKSISEYPVDAPEWECMEDGVMTRNYEQFAFFIHTIDDLEKGSTIPKMVSFRSSSHKVGKDLITHIYKMVEQKKNPASEILELGSKFIDKGSKKYYSYTIKTTGVESKKEHQLAALKTVKSVKNQKSKIQNMQEEVEVKDHKPTSEDDL